jgi:hypothetical protein
MGFASLPLAKPFFMGQRNPHGTSEAHAADMAV